MLFSGRHPGAVTATDATRGEAPASRDGIDPVRRGKGMRLIHTADWQIGKVFRFVDQPTMHVLQEARLEAVSTIGRLARERGAQAVLVAGDVYDHDGVSDRTLARPIERMRAFSNLEWHLVPGNHDPERTGGVWQRLLRQGLPASVKVHLEPEPAPLGDGPAWLLPAPLRHRPAADPTAWMDHAPTPEGALRIGVAHGSIREFGSAAGSAVIDPARPERAGLAYLALGDWHGMRRIGERCRYSGTPEVDGFDVHDGGHALLVEIASAAAPPSIEAVPVGRFCWRREHARVHDEHEIEALEHGLRGLGSELADVLLELVVEGTLSLAARVVFEERIVRALGAALRHLRVDDTGLLAAPSGDDLDAIGHTGVVRRAAERLRSLADDPDHAERDVARAALLRLYLEQHKAGTA